MSQWREVEEKEFCDFIQILSLSPQSGVSNGVMSATRFGTGIDANVLAEISEQGGIKTFRIFMGLQNSER